MIVDKSSIDIPVVVDAIRMHREFPMVRCSYLSIECDSPVSSLSINIDDWELPLLIMGLAGIVIRPLSAKLFSDVEFIEELYRRIEDQAGLLIDIDDLWLPSLLFDSINMTPDIGHVYRLKRDLFVLAFSFREGNMDVDTFIDGCKRLPQSVLFSPDEMSAFSAWRKLQIETAKKLYPKNRDIRLRYRDEEGSE
jgi:hypothetical protein